MSEWRAFTISGRDLSRVSIEGETAFAVEQATYTFTTVGETVILEGAQTFVARRTKAGWRLTHLHFSGKRRKPAEPSKIESKP